MAQIKVTRRSMRPEEWTQLRFNWLKRHIYLKKVEISPLYIKDARQVDEMQFEYYSDDFRPLHKGDLYFTPDGTSFLQADFAIPDEFKGKKVWLTLKTAAEICIKCNGKFIGGVDPNRERMLLSPYIDENETIHLEAMGYNRSKPDDERAVETLAVRGCRQIFEGAYLALVNDAVQNLVWDFELLLDIAQSELFSEDYRTFLNRELSNAMDLIDFESNELSGVEECQKYIEEKIYSNDNYRGSGDVALVAHSHLDIAYYWRKIHSVQKNLRTVLIQLRLMDRYPDFKYTHTQPYLYETLQKYYPDVFEELKQKVSNGQFEPVGAMYVEPDCNIPSAESLIRQCLYGQQTYKRLFGKTVNNAWLPDVFGNSWILPQILKKSGVDYFVSNKMSTWNDTNRFPHNNFIWRGLDGSEIYACVPPTHFITWNMPSQIQANWDAYQDKDIGGQTLNMFGYGDGGSGCTEDMLEMMKRFDKLSIMPKTQHMSGKEFLEDNFINKKNLPVWDGELYLEMHRGTFTTKADLKQINRRLEFKFRNAEIVSICKNSDNQSFITELYKRFLVNQFHDILPGSHVHPVFEDAMAEYCEIEKELDKILFGSSLFNSLNFAREMPAFIEDENGQFERYGQRGYFACVDAPSMSKAKIIENDGLDDWIMVDDVVQTPFYTMKFADDGSIVSLYDKELGRQWVEGEFNKLHLFSDRPGNYDAWDILPNYRDKQYDFTVQKPLTLKTVDSFCAEFSTILCSEKSKFEVIVRLFKNFRGIEVEHKVEWHEKHVLLKAEFEPAILSRTAFCDTSAGFIERQTHRNTSWDEARFEVCHHKWVDMSETDGGLAIINMSKYGVGLLKNRISLSLLRSTIRPDVESDMGEHNYSYLIFPHAGGAVEAKVNKLALEYNVNLINSDISWNLPTFEPLFLQAAKLSEDGSMKVIRLSEQDGRRGAVKLPSKVKILDMLENVIEESDEISYMPFEIITIGI